MKFVSYLLGGFKISFGLIFFGLNWLILFRNLFGDEPFSSLSVGAIFFMVLFYSCQQFFGGLDTFREKKILPIWLDWTGVVMAFIFIASLVYKFLVQGIRVNRFSLIGISIIFLVSIIDLIPLISRNKKRS
jgi:hypothetical protein